MRVRTRLNRITIVGACCLGLGGGLASAGVITASAIPPTSCVVNATNDAGNGGGGTCDTSVPGVVTLRSAIDSFNNAPIPGFTITFAPSTNATPIGLSLGTLTVLGTTGNSLIITGNGMTNTIVDGLSSNRLVSIGASGNVPDVTFNNLTLKNGNGPKTAGIHVEDTSLGTLNLNGVELTGNQVTGGHVDGDSVDAATLNITGSLITGNTSTASTAGGADGNNRGEVVAQTTTITNTSVTNNTIDGALNHDTFGVIRTNNTTIASSHIDGNTLATTGTGRTDSVIDTSITVIRDSSVDNNTLSTGASGTNNGVLDTGNLDIERSSVSGNSVTVGDLGTTNAIIWPEAINTIADDTVSANTYTVGRSATVNGFLYEVGNNDDQHFTNDTMAKNTLTLGPGASVTGGSFDFGTGDTTSISNVILSGNTPTNCNGTVLPAGVTSHSLDSDSSCGIGSTSGNLSGVDPKLGPLQVNTPGATRTMAIDSTSPAYNTADNTTCPTIDQRGVTRLFAGDNLCDMGAYEAPLPLAAMVPAAAPALPKAGQITRGGRPGALPGALMLLLAAATALGIGLGGRRRNGRA